MRFSCCIFIVCLMEVLSGSTFFFRFAWLWLSESNPGVCQTFFQQWHQHTHAHTCAHASFCWLGVLKLLQCTTALLTLQCLTGRCWVSVGCGRGYTLSLSAEWRHVWPNRKSLLGVSLHHHRWSWKTLRNKNRQALLSHRVELMPKIHWYLNVCLEHGDRKEFLVLNFVPVALSGLKWGPAEVRCSDSWDDNYVSELPRTTTRAWQQCF